MASRMSGLTVNSPFRPRDSVHNDTAAEYELRHIPWYQNYSPAQLVRTLGNNGCSVRTIGPLYGSPLNALQRCEFDTVNYLRSGIYNLAWAFSFALLM